MMRVDFWEMKGVFDVPLPNSNSRLTNALLKLPTTSLSVPQNSKIQHEWKKESTKMASKSHIYEINLHTD